MWVILGDKLFELNMLFVICKLSVILEIELVNFLWENDIDWVCLGLFVSENFVFLDNLKEFCNKVVCVIMIGKDIVGEILLYGDVVCVLFIFMLLNVLVILFVILEFVLFCM